MSDMLQYIIVGIVVAVAIVLAVRSIYRAMTHKKSALIECTNCKLNEVCKKNNQEKKNCCKKN